MAVTGHHARLGTRLLARLYRGRYLKRRSSTRFQGATLIEPDKQISRIRLSDKTSRLSFRVQRLLQFLNTCGVDRLPNLQVLHHVLRLS